MISCLNNALSTSLLTYFPISCIIYFEYAAFFGSIQIFKYLYKNFVEFTSELWLLAIHGDDEEMIHILEENNILPPKVINYNYFIKKHDTYMICVKEAIKCHHNHIVSYIQSNLSTEDIEHINYLDDYDENIFSYCFHYFNFAYLPTIVLYCKMKKLIYIQKKKLIY